MPETGFPERRHGRIPRIIALLIALAARIVPKSERDHWRREWGAEITHRWLRIESLGGRRTRVRPLLTRALAVFPDAIGMRLEGLRQGFLLDLRHSLRGFRRQPRFVLFVVGILSIGIGANATLYGVVDAVLARPLPYPEPDRLVKLWETQGEEHAPRSRVSPGDFQYWRAHSDVFDAVAAWYGKSLGLQTGDDALMLSAAQVSNDYFRVMGVKPLLGRTFTDEEVDRAVYDSSNTHRGEDPVVVLSHRIWRQHFGADPGILGRSISLERGGWRVIGVMPAEFRAPSPSIDLWVGWSFAHDRPRDQRYVEVVGRLRPGLSVEEAASRMTALSRRMAEEFPDTNAGWEARLVPLHRDIVGDAGPALLVVFGAVGCVLGIICVNIANLLLVRASGQKREHSIRVALGASRLRIVRQRLVECLLLSGAGGAIGLLIAWYSIGALRRLGPAGIPRLDEIAAGPRVAAFTGVITCVTALWFGLLPALTGTRGHVSEGLKEGDERTGREGRSSTLRKNALVTLEVGLATLLLVGAGLLGRTVANLRAAPLGFDPENVLVMPMLLDGGAYDGDGSRLYYERLMERLASLPAVVAVGGATALPLSPIGPDFDIPVWPVGSAPSGGGETRADVRIVTPGYFETLGMPMMRGRSFSTEDDEKAPRRVVVNETLADRYWDKDDAVGRRLVVDYASTGSYAYEIIGVVSDVRFYGPRALPRPEVYFPHRQRPYLILNMAVRTRGEPRAAIPDLRRAILAIDPARPPHGLIPLQELELGAIDRERFALGLVGMFATLALVLSALGIYGVLSFRVAERTHEIGVRMTFGAGRGDVVRLVMSQGMQPVFAGMVLGVLGSMALGEILKTLLHGVTPVDTGTLSAVTTTLLTVAALACYLPARRAATIDPLRALRDS